MNQQKKLKILFHSDFALAKTGFGRVAKCLLSYLYNTGKYEIVHYCCHTEESSPQLQLTPWKSIGCIPAENIVQQVIANNAKNPEEGDAIRKHIYYGGLKIDDIINSEKPDVYIATQDIWGVDYSVERDWFNKIHSVIWTTLDSLPLFPRALQIAPKVKDYWIWSSFATKEFHRKGFNHVKTMHGPLESKYFYRKSDEERQKIREANNIEKDRFMIGFVFRNQLRKSVPNLLEGYKKFKDKNPGIKSGLLLHTHFSEPPGNSWDIMNYVAQNEINPKEIYTTYICRNCSTNSVKNYEGDGIKCPKCGTPNSYFTTHLAFGVKEEDLNNVYNLMDVYCHPFTSGGQEIPIQESKFCELITLVTNYSCGEEMNDSGSGSLPLEWDKYFEPGSNFIKATTKPESIATQLQKVLEMSLEERKLQGKISREWALTNFSKESVGKAFEEYLDNLTAKEWVEKAKVGKSPNAIVDNIPDNALWIKTLYKEILKMDVDESDEGFRSWIVQIQRGVSRQQIEAYFRDTASKENQKMGIEKPLTLEDLLDKNDEGRRILYVMPEGIGDIVLSLGLMKSLKEQYPNYNIYFATNPKFFEALEGNDFIHKVIPYAPIMDNLLYLEGNGNHKGYFEIAFLPHVTTQRVLTYVHNGKTNIAFNIKDK